MAALESRVVHRRDKIRNVEFEERLVKVSRVVKVVKGGRIFSFSALVVIGNKSGYFGIGLGKALAVNDAKRKAINDAKNNLCYICLTKAKTIPHEVEAKYGATKVVVRPAKPGTGIIAGGAMRMIFECLGVKDVVCKIISSTNPHNVSKAGRVALLKLKSHRYFNMFHKALSQEEILSDATEDDLGSNEFETTES